MTKWIYVDPEKGWQKAEDAVLTPRTPPKHSGDVIKNSTFVENLESRSLPRNWKHHEGEFAPDGKPRFRNRKEIDEAIARADWRDGTEIHYNEL